MSTQAKIAVIGGSGLYNMRQITATTAIRVNTPFGQPSSDIMIGTLSGKRVAFLARHGAGHVYNPSTVPYAANIYALKTLGVRFIICVSACGSLQEEIVPGHMVVPDQIYDNTKGERGGRTFFDDGLIAHVSVADPFCEPLRHLLKDALVQTDAMVHDDGTLVVIEGPRFSTRAESHVYRQLGLSIIGMTTAPEAFLAREAEIAYASISHVTDYDVWHIDVETVTADMVMQRVATNLKIIQQAIAIAVEQLDEETNYPCHNALAAAIITAPNAMSSQMKEKLEPIVGKYLNP